MSRQLAELLVKDKIISQFHFEQAETAVKGGATSYVRFLIEKNHLAESKLLYYLGQKFGLPSINLKKFEIEQSILRIISPEIAYKHAIVPIQSAKGTLVVALCDPSMISGFENLKFRLKMNIEAVLTSYSAFDAALSKYYGGAATVGAAIASFQGNKENTEALASMDLVQVHEIQDGGTSADQDAPVITAVNGILSESIRRAASDIHIEPYEKRFRVRMRIDGTLMEIAQLPIEMKRAMLARIKIMSRMDIAESRVPQDGRIKLKQGNSEIDFRVNTMPTLFGEKAVLRLLNKGNLHLDLTKLGFEAGQLVDFKKGIYAPNGMVLVTGPTGSGKTTTLYSALSELNQVTDNLSTAEDPVEYNLDGINQVQVHKEIGLTFAAVLRALLRQDPDVVLVGEIRDYETAEVAVQAALTGHLVLSTLHTNDAVSTITRLMNMGIEPFLIVSSTNTIVAQRLLRTICSGCAVQMPIPVEKLVTMGVPEPIAAQMKCMKGQGCQKCNKTGYKGRIAIYEVLTMTPAIKEMVLSGATVLDLKKQAAKDGMKSLRMAAITKAAEGKTTLEEALSMTMET
ncbi:MAG: type IV-A pilus assembly ATPase PilB [Bdellovibrionales bacterium GWB1_52_6]|nr:MAG: type IV-A pilus assembly ATPase PilB [Bdellovibrionales bacterium GWB1_52_6]OFZ02548.1 MAG: type IV-A pilus assembly ATPase PilB [Bdellovibrionales bacterium GWA1_52_35]HCM41397.1 type IV-A pilus assembly ATPase PilB [Bdellovibrionales bacterium]